MRRFLPSLSALQAFEAAARYMSFTKAGDELAITQSGISRQINNLERVIRLNRIAKPLQAGRPLSKAFRPFIGSRRLPANA